MSKDDSLEAQDKVIAICESLGATEYVNAIGGKNLYADDAFAKQGIQLSFVESQPATYAQFGDEFVVNLSIVYVLMFNDREACRSMLHDYSIAS